MIFQNPSYPNIDFEFKDSHATLLEAVNNTTNRVREFHAVLNITYRDKPFVVYETTLLHARRDVSDFFVFQRMHVPSVRIIKPDFDTVREFSRITGGQHVHAIILDKLRMLERW